MTTFSLFLRAGMRRLAFWRRQVTPAAEPSLAVDTNAQAAAIQPDPEPAADIPTPVVKSGLLARITQTLPFKRSVEETPAPESAPEERDATPDENNSAPEQTAKLSLGARITQSLTFFRKTGTHIETAEPPAAESTPSDTTAKLSLTMRITNMFRPQPDADDTAAAEAEETTTATNKTAAMHTKADASPDTEAQVPARPNRFKVMLVWVFRKKVLIPASGVAVLLVSALIGFTLMQSAQEKEKLHAELENVKQELEKQKRAKPLRSIAPNFAPKHLAQAVEKPPVSEPPQPSSPEVKPADPSYEIPGMKTAASASKVASSDDTGGDCIITDKESVAANLKRCIEGFNAATGR